MVGNCYTICCGNSETPISYELKKNIKKIVELKVKISDGSCDRN